MTMFGRRNTKARKLTAYEVQQIRKAYAEGETQGALARAYGMSVGQIGRIVRGESWSGGLMPQGVSAAELEASAQRLLDLQHSLSKPPGPVPVSPLDGGSVPEETAGTGTATLAAHLAEKK